MGNCLQLVRRAETPHHSSDPSKASSKKAVSSAHSSQTTYSNPSTLTVPSYTSTLTVQSSSYTERSNTENLPTRTEEEILASSGLKDFPFNELRIATRNFRPESLIGEGGFGNVYKGWIDEQTFTAAKPGSGMIVAVKKLKQESFQGHKEWLAEVNYLGQLRHPNLVKLIGYCSDGENRLLVYEYLLKGSLENHLFRRSTQPLNWALRIKVAVGAARGLTFLHESELQIIYRDVKSSNILLDSEYNVKLSDFGLAKEGPTGGKTHISTQIMGTQGYAAPEYIATGLFNLNSRKHLNLEVSKSFQIIHLKYQVFVPIGRLSVMADVYSYGVVLLELLSGRRAVDNSRGGKEQNLVEWARPLLADKRKQNLIMDSRLEGRYPKKDAHAVATLASQCISTQAKSRPKMSEVLATLEALQT